MKIHRFITEYKISENNIEIKDYNIIHQIKDVLKLRKDQICIITSEDNVEYVSKILETAKGKIVLEILEKKLNKNEPVKIVRLYLSILKKENFETVVQKAGEMGIHEITPIISKRTIKTKLNHQRLNKIAREASELSGRSQVTKINEIMDFKKAIESDKNENKILFDISGKKLSQGTDQKYTSIYVGPEGGYDEDEITYAEKHGVHIASLGKLTLRGETAGIIASYLVLNF